jgi:hypothetical protein
VADASYKPVFLNHYTYDLPFPESMYPSECGRILEELELLDFEGETVIIMDSSAVTVIPDQYFSEETSLKVLEKTASPGKSDILDHRFIRDRNFHIVYSYPNDIEKLAGQIKGKVQIMHSAECVVSLSDQVQASDHQRGFVLVEVQAFTLHLLVIQEDGVLLLNQFTLKDSSEFIYHTLNSMKQLGMEREKIPVYLSGIIHQEHELYGLLGKYVRHVKTTPYYLEHLSRAEVLQFMILSEGSKCV